MSQILEGRTFSWVTWDPALAISSALRGMLMDRFQGRQVRVSLDLAPNLEEALALTQRNQPSLLSLVGDCGQALQMAKVLRQVRGRSPTTVRLVYLSTNLEQWLPLLMEAHAQLVLGDLPSLQRLIPLILEVAKLKHSGYHPLTSGLVDRLPWPDARPNSH